MQAVINSKNSTESSNESSQDKLITEIKTLIVNAVGLHHVKLADIKAETSLRAGGLELDSVDILEVVVVIEHHFGVKVENAEIGMKYFKTIGTIADFITVHKSQKL